jgi:hypothetical protein
MGYDVKAGNILTVTNTEDVGTAATAPEGSFRKILSKAAEGDTIVFDPSLKNDTIYISQSITSSINNLTIRGNGITIFGKKSNYLRFSSASVTVENMGFNGKMYLALYNITKGIVRGCIFNGCASVGLMIQKTLSLVENKYCLVEGCSFSNIGSSSGEAIVISNSASTPLSVDVVSCTFVDNVLQSEKSDKKAGITISAYKYGSLEPVVRIANCVFRNNKNVAKDPLYYQDLPVIASKDLTSLGYNIIEGKLSSEGSQKIHETDVLSEDVGEVFRLEDSIYKVLKTGKAYQNFPANTTIAGIEMPEHDVLETKIDYTQATHSGACQEVFTSDDASLFQLISEYKDIVDIKEIYPVPLSHTASTAVFTVVPAAPKAKVYLGETELENKQLTVDVSKPSVQTVTFKIVSADETNTGLYTLKVEKRFNFDAIVITRWNNSLIVNNNSATNGGFEFVGYKWFKEGTEIGTGQYYSAGQKKTDLLAADGKYWVQLITKDGQTLRTWESEKIALKSSTGLKVYPNPLQAGEAVSVQLDIDPELLTDAVIEVYNINGAKVNSVKAAGVITQVALPASAGIYVIKVRSGNFVEEKKLIIK